MNDVIIAMSIETNDVLSGAVLDPKTMDCVYRCPDTHYEQLDEGCSSFVHEALRFCHQRGITPDCLGICTKGEAKDGTITLQPGADPCPVKKILESQFAIPVAILNRFQAFSFGAFCLLNKTVADSLGVINLSDGVGCGVIKNGQLIQEYDKDSGMGGLQIVRRLSDGNQMTIAQIAGVESVRARSRYQGCSIGKLFEDGVNGKDDKNSAFIRDIAHSVALLAGNTAKKYGIFDFYVNVYDDCDITSADKQGFVEIVRTEIHSTSELPINLCLFAPESGEEDVKIFGVARIARAEYIDGGYHYDG
ncbi:MAG: ROK family protein [Holosporales bacterium]|nr:ROK family protein [Holosporales bacterium]